VRRLYARPGPEEFYRRRLAWLASIGKRTSHDRLVAYLRRHDLMPESEPRACELMSGVFDAELRALDGIERPS
jgi:hypothetical protein